MEQKLIDSLTLENNRGPLADAYFYEHVNMDIFCKVINSKLLLTYFDSEHTGKVFENERTQLIARGQAYDREKKMIKIKYHTGKTGYGRVYAGGSYAMINIRRELRHLLAIKDFNGSEESYAVVDIDIENAQPVLLEQMCVKHVISCPELTKYVNDREGYLQRVMDDYGVVRDVAKNLFIMLLFGGTMKT